MPELPIRIAIADKDPMFRTAVAERITAHGAGMIRVVLQAGNGAELLTRLETTMPDIVLMDLNMPVLDGFSTARYLNVLFPEVTLVGFLQELDESRVVEMGQGGLHSLICKDEAPSRMVSVLQRIAGGETYRSPAFSAFYEVI